MHLLQDRLLTKIKISLLLCIKWFVKHLFLNIFEHFRPKHVKNNIKQKSSFFPWNVIKVPVTPTGHIWPR
jgi:hypothetical protein